MRQMWTYQGFLSRMVYLYYISCLRYTILVKNPWYAQSSLNTWLRVIFLKTSTWVIQDSTWDQWRDNSFSTKMSYYGWNYTRRLKTSLKNYFPCSIPMEDLLFFLITIVLLFIQICCSWISANLWTFCKQKQTTQQSMICKMLNHSTYMYFPSVQLFLKQFFQPKGV